MSRTQTTTKPAALPRLLYDSHMHTPLCKHAVGQPEQYAAAGYEANLRGIVFTCHNPLPDGLSATVRMSEDEFSQYLDMVAKARQQWDGRLDVRLGLECDYVPGLDLRDYLEKQVASQPFDYLLGSVHPHMRMYKALYNPADPIRFQQRYFEHLAETAEQGLFDCLSHPDLVKNVTPQAWEFGQIAEHVSRSLDRIARTGIAMELNTSGWNKAVPEQNPTLPMLQLMAEREIPVVLGSDSHVPERVGDRFVPAMDLLKQAGYREVVYYLGRQQHRLPIDQAVASLGPRREAVA